MLGAFAQLGWWTPWLAWIALVPWLAWLDREPRLRRVLGAGYALTLAFTASVFWWFGLGIAAYAAAPAWQGVLALLVLAPVLQPQLVVWSVARALLVRRGVGGAALALASAAGYVAIEWLTPKLFADTLGHGFFTARTLRQAADLAGAPGLTFAVVLGNECVAAALRARTPRRALPAAAALAALVLALFAYGRVRIAEVERRAAAAPPLRAALIQADISRYGRLRTELGTHDAVRAILDAHFALSSEAIASGPLDFVAWPETVYPTTFGAPRSEAGAAFDREIAAFVLETGTPLVFGAYDVDGAAEFNAAIFLSAERSAPGAPPRVGFEAYRKASLFPLTEQVPALFESSAVRSALPWLGAWKPGPGPTVIEVPLRDGRRLRVGPLICYDAVSPRLARESVRRGAEVLVTLSNDSWFAEGGGPLLHLAVATFRSIETRRPQLRATNTGITAAIDATGTLVATAGVHERAAVVASVAPERDATTLALAWGDWLGPVALAGSLVTAFAGGRR